jgi:hypothetical protein
LSIIRKAISVRKPTRVLLSMISIRHSAVKPRRLRMPQPPRRAAGAESAARAAGDAVERHRPLPGITRHQQQAQQSAEGEFSDIAEQVVGAQRGAPAGFGIGIGDDR